MTAAAACDVKGTQHNQSTLGPPIRIVGTNVDGPDAQIPADGVVQIAFDRYLLPSTTSRQSWVVLDASRQPLPGQPFRTIYDPVARIVTLAGPDGPGKPWLTEGQTYRLVLPVAPNDDDIGGFRAIDRATLAEPRELLFRAGPPTRQTALDPPVNFCADVLPLFKAKCSDPTCHGSTESPAASLILQSAEGVRWTAVGRVAQGANTSAHAYSPEPDDKIFGVNMAIVSKSNPGSSWLMYKLELAPPMAVDAGPIPNIVCTPPPDAPSVPPKSTAEYQPLVHFEPQANDVERAILSSYVLGREMPFPYPPALYAEEQNYYYTPLTFQERERIRIWIAGGAETPECGGCDIREVSDAGP